MVDSGETAPGGHHAYVHTNIARARFLLLAVFLTLAVGLGFVASAAFSADSPAQSQIQGDVNCDTQVDATDVLGELDHVAEVTPAAQTEPCTDIGLALPEVAGPKGDKGDPGVQGPPGINLFANVTISGNTVTIVDGNATQVLSFGTGEYYLQFAQNIQHCAAVASAGSTAGGNYSTNAIVTTHIDLPSTTSGVMAVQIVDPQGHPLDSDFHVIVVC